MAYGIIANIKTDKYREYTYISKKLFYGAARFRISFGVGETLVYKL